MSSRKKYIILLFVVVVLLIGICVIIYIGSDDKTTNELLIGSTNDGTLDSKEEDSISNDSDVDTSDNKDNLDNDGVNINVNDDYNYVYTEEDVVEYFSFMEEEVSESSSFKEKFKEYFIILIDFIFYDKEIKGYTFSELSGTAKAKVIGIALKIDSKIEEYVPNYKESISSTGSEIYTNVKEKLVTLYMDISIEICEDNVEECTKVKEIFSDIKDTCSIGWDFIKNLVSSGGSKIKEWYEIYSGK